MYDRTRGRARIGVVVAVLQHQPRTRHDDALPAGGLAALRPGRGLRPRRHPRRAPDAALLDAPFEEVVDSLRACRPDVMLYGCTSATLAQGPAFDAGFRRRIEERAGAPTVTAASAVIEALEDLGVERIAFSSPYVSSLNDHAGVVHRGVRLPMRGPGRHRRSPRQRRSGRAHPGRRDGARPRGGSRAGGGDRALVHRHARGGGGAGHRGELGEAGGDQQPGDDARRPEAHRRIAPRGARCAGNALQGAASEVPDGPPVAVKA